MCRFKSSGKSPQNPHSTFVSLYRLDRIVLCFLLCHFQYDTFVGRSFIRCLFAGLGNMYNIRQYYSSEMQHIEKPEIT